MKIQATLQDEANSQEAIKQLNETVDTLTKRIQQLQEEKDQKEYGISPHTNNDISNSNPYRTSHAGNNEDHDISQLSNLSTLSRRNNNDSLR